MIAVGDTHGDIVQTYEYSINAYREADDADRPHAYLFTGQRFDIETLSLPLPCPLL